jgi:hypothetical protein
MHGTGSNNKVLLISGPTNKEAPFLVLPNPFYAVISDTFDKENIIVTSTFDLASPRVRQVAVQGTVPLISTLVDILYPTKQMVQY